MQTLPVDDALAAAYARDGVVCVRSVLDAGEVAAAARAIDAVLASPGPLVQVASGADDPGAFTEDFCRWREIPEIERLARHSRVPAIAAALMATPQVRFYHDHVLVKQGRTRQRTPWHQDQPYYNVDGHGVSAWIPVDAVPAAGCLELVATSHRGPWLMPRTFLRGEARWFQARGRTVRDASGQLVRMGGSVTDIEYRKQTEAQLFAEKERAEVTLASIADAVITAISNDPPSAINRITGSTGSRIGWPLMRIGSPASSPSLAGLSATNAP